MPAAPAVDLIAHADHDGQQQQMAAHARKTVGQAHDGVDQDAHHDHDQQEAGAAAGMEAALRPDVFNREGLAVLIAEDRLVLGPVIGEEALDVAHLADEAHIDQQDHDPQRAFGEIAREEVFLQRADQPDEKGGKENE